MKVRSQIIIGIAGAALLVVILGGVKAFQISAAIAQAQARQQPPEAVTSYQAKAQTWARTISAVGTMSAIEGATLRAEEPGKVVEINFNSGSEVEKGQVLVVIDASVEQAQLNGVLAKLELAEITAKRQRALREKRANSQSDLDEAEANLRDLQAEADRLRAVVERKKIVAPYAGKAGIRQVNVGDMLRVGDAVVSVNSYENLFVDFTLPQSAIDKVEEGHELEITVDTFPGETFTGTVSAVEPVVDPTTRNFSVQGTLQNPDGKLRPGMFASASVVLPEKDTVVAIPSSSISYAPYGDSVWILDKPVAEAENVFSVRSQVVKLGRTRGDLVEVFSGVKDGDTVVSSGVFKLRPDVQVLVNNSVKPSSELAPNPKDT